MGRHHDFELTKNLYHRYISGESLSDIASDLHLTKQALHSRFKSCSLKLRKYTPKNFALKLSGYNRCDVCDDIKALKYFDSMKNAPQYKYNICITCRTPMMRDYAHNYYIKKMMKKHKNIS